MLPETLPSEAAVTSYHCRHQYEQHIELPKDSQMYFLNSQIKTNTNNSFLQSISFLFYGIRFSFHNTAFIQPYKISNKEYKQ